MMESLKLKNQFKRIAVIVNSDISTKSQIELCKQSWREYEMNKILISNSTISGK